MDLRVQFERGVASWSGLPQRALPEIALMGRSNVGKSSLFNAICRRKQLARVSGQPGKTQELNYYCVDDRAYLVDVPGLGYARVSKSQREAWQRLLGRYLVEREVLTGVVYLIDARHEPTAIDQQVMQTLSSGRRPVWIVLTKSDKLSGNKRATALRAIENHVTKLPWLIAPTVLMTSSVDGRGIDVLRSALWQQLGLDSANIG